MAIFGTVSADNPLSFKNLIINGDMRIAQRGNTFSNLTDGSDVYTLDRWRWDERGSPTVVYEVTQSSNAPAGFSKSLRTQVTTTGTVTGSVNYLSHAIEGLNVGDLAWGTADAKPVTLSFWVKSNLTGISGGSIVDSNSGASTGSYLRGNAFEFQINAADTWEYKTITFTGDTGGTWSYLNTTSAGLILTFCLARDGFSYAPNTWRTEAGAIHTSTNQNINLITLGNYIEFTGVQLEVGSVATPFERRPYGLEFSLCQRYYQIFYPTAQELIYIESNAATQKWWSFTIPEPMRTTPSVTASAGMTGGTVAGLAGVTISSLTLEGSSLNRISFRVNMSGTGGTAYNIAHTDGFSGDSVALSAEL